MPRRKKRPKLPSGWGSIRFLGKGRRNPYAVHPPCTDVDDNGNYIRPKAICYVSSWDVGFAVLNSLRAGTYKPGDELDLEKALEKDDGLELLEKKILQDYGQWHGAQERTKTFADVYELFYDWKYGKHAAKQLSESRKKVTRTAYKNLSVLHEKAFNKIRIEDLQDAINQCPLGRSSLELMKLLLTEMYKFAEARELCDKDLARHVVIPSGAKEDEHGVPFTGDELQLLWADRMDPDSEMLLIMCYSGYRISAYRSLEVNLEGEYFKGGLKTAAGKERVVPIHSSIRELVATRLARDHGLLIVTGGHFTRRMKSKLSALGIEGNHTPHDCRHTFSMLCERYGVPEADRKRMLGHSFGADITNSIYGHRSVEDLRASIELIPAPPNL